MTDRQLRWLLSAYPRAWRKRYGDEVEELAQAMWSSGETTRARLVVDLVGAGLAVRGRWAHRWVRSSLVLPVGAAAMIGVALIAFTTGGPRPVVVGSAAVVLTQNGVRTFGSDLGLRSLPSHVRLLGTSGVIGFVLGDNVFGAAGSGLNGSPDPGAALTVFGAAGDPVGSVVPIIGFLPTEGNGPPASAAPSFVTTAGSAKARSPVPAVAASAGSGRLASTVCAARTSGPVATSESSACSPSVSVVPALVGTSTPIATAHLSAMGLAAEVQNVTCAAGTSGQVAATTPAAGSSIAAGGVVTLENCS